MVYVLLSIVLILIFVIWWLSRRLRTINRKLAYFFDSLDNNDYTLRFTATKGLPSEKLLNHSLNRIKTIIQHVRLDIQQKEKYYELILSSINTGVIALNSKGFVIQSNQFALKLLGMKIFTHINQLNQVSPPMMQLFMEIQPGDSRQITYTNEKGKLQLLVSATNIIINGEKVTLLVLNDIENEMDKKEIDSWIRLIRVLSHEIMNSIAPITSLSDTLLNFHREDPPTITPEQIRHNTINGLQVISETGKGLISFVESYRKFTRIPEPEKQHIDLDKFIHRMITLCSMEPYFEHISIQTDIHPQGLKVYADPNLLGQAILNIMKNAIQSMKSQASGTLHIRAEKTGSGATSLQITDNGPGIPPEILNEIFVPFFTTKEEGSGIGLSIARQIMRAHGGNIKATSIPNQKTTFTLTI